ncbi:MAG: SsrA-binding protein [Chloroflexota bacterium]|jgi:SsrA-binding protein|nr:SsrA-binding protein [Chloroflexota bacterium]
MSPDKPADGGDKVVANNRAAFHEYFILDSVEAGLELLGTEVKSLREGKANIKDGYVRIENGQAYLHNVDIQPWAGGNRNNHERLRSRRLLMHKSEIQELYGKQKEQGLSIVPLRLYFHRGRAKLEIALVKGKKSWDKRQSIAERDAKREMDRAIRRDVR